MHRNTRRNWSLSNVSLDHHCFGIHSPLLGFLFPRCWWKLQRRVWNHHQQYNVSGSQYSALGRPIEIFTCFNSWRICSWVVLSLVQRPQSYDLSFLKELTILNRSFPSNRRGQYNRIHMPGGPESLRVGLAYEDLPNNPSIPLNTIRLVPYSSGTRE
jgi:hypothetical protein